MSKPKYKEAKWLKHPNQPGKAPFKVEPNLIDAYLRSGFKECAAPVEDKKKTKSKKAAANTKPTVEQLKGTLKLAGVEVEDDWDEAKLIEEINKL